MNLRSMQIEISLPLRRIGGLVIIFTFQVPLNPLENDLYFYSNVFESMHYAALNSGSVISRIFLGTLHILPVTLPEHRREVAIAMFTVFGITGPVFKLGLTNSRGRYFKYHCKHVQVYQSVSSLSKQPTVGFCEKVAQFWSGAIYVTTPGTFQDN